MTAKIIVFRPLVLGENHCFDQCLESTGLLLCDGKKSKPKTHQNFAKTFAETPAHILDLRHNGPRQNLNFEKSEKVLILKSETLCQTPLKKVWESNDGKFYGKTHLAEWSPNFSSWPFPAHSAPLWHFCSMLILFTENSLTLDP